MCKELSGGPNWGTGNGYYERELVQTMLKRRPVRFLGPNSQF